MALWKAREGKVHKKSDFRSKLEKKSWILDHGIVEGRGEV